MKNTVENLIIALQKIKDVYGENIPVSINLISDRNLALKSICLDNSDEEYMQIYFEADLEDKAEMSSDIKVYSQDGILEDILKYERQKHEVDTFTSDLDKVADLLFLDNKEEFLQSYYYVPSEDYEATAKHFYPNKEAEELSDENLSIVHNLANLMRQAENLYIEELNDRKTCWNILGSELKGIVADFVNKHFTEKQIAEFQELCEEMAC